MRRLSRRERRAWHAVQRQLEKQIGTIIVFPEWFEQIAKRLFVDDLRVRRYYPAFVEACRTVCLIRSFQLGRTLSNHRELEVDFADFAITGFIFDPCLSRAFTWVKVQEQETRRLVGEIAARKRRAVGAKEALPASSTFPLTRPTRELRYAEQVGVIRRANEPEKGNRKLFLPVPPTTLCSRPQKALSKIERSGDTVRFVHPITGQEIVYRRERD